jgi:hypothetical protein
VGGVPIGNISPACGEDRPVRIEFVREREAGASGALMEEVVEPERRRFELGCEVGIGIEPGGAAGSSVDEMEWEWEWERRRVSSRVRRLT